MAGEAVATAGSARDASGVMVTVAVSTGVGVTVAEMTMVEVKPSVPVMTVVTLTLSGVGVNVGIGRCVGVGGSVADGVTLVGGRDTLVGARVGVALGAGELSMATSGTRRDRATRPPMPRQ